MKTVDLEVLQNIIHPADMDNFCSRYELQSKKYDLKVIYPAFEYQTLEENFFRLIATSTLETFKPRWYMRPDYVSYDFYDTVLYWYIILFVNSVPRIEDFKDFDKIYVPNRNTISDLITEKISRYEFIPDKEEVNNKIRVYLKSKLTSIRPDFSAPKRAQQTINKPSSVDSEQKKSEVPELVEKSEIFVLTNLDISRKTIILSTIPVNQTSVNVYLTASMVPLRYGYDYIVSGNQIKWSSELCIGGQSVLEKIARPGLGLRVTYLVLKSL